MLSHLYERKGQRYRQRQQKHPDATPMIHAHSRPWRDRAMIYFFLATGVRREELINLNLDQVQPSVPTELRTATIAKVSNVSGKGNTRRNVYLRLMHVPLLPTILNSSARPMLTAFLIHRRCFFALGAFSTRKRISRKVIPMGD